MTKSIHYNAEFLNRYYDASTNSYLIPMTPSVAADLCDAYGWNDEIKRLREELIQCHETMNSMLDKIERLTGEPDFDLRSIFHDLHVAYHQEPYWTRKDPTKGGEA